jgi:hypothetical protein
VAFCALFDIDLPAALLGQLLTAFDVLLPGALTLSNLETVPTSRGVYQLYHQGQLVYVGKADKLRLRLRKHRSKIGGRANISLSDVEFKCLYMSVNWSTLAPESQLIGYYQQTQNGYMWNGRGFGPNDPGAGREDRNDPPAYFDSTYPINENWVCSDIEARSWYAGDLLLALKKSLPFLLRYQKPHADYASTVIDVPQSNMSAVALLTLIAQCLPTGWQATVFPSHMILYKRVRGYQYGSVVWPAQLSALIV